MEDKHYLRHLKNSKSLETSYEAVRAGFVALALEKNRRAIPFVAEARALKISADKAHSPAALLTIPDIQPALLTAAGISDKAATHLNDADKREAIDGLIENFLKPSGTNFIEELVFRFLLIRGDTFGGSMRNIAGFVAQKKVTRSIIAQLTLFRRNCLYLHQHTKQWMALPHNDEDIETSICGLGWNTEKGPRKLLYNVTVPLFRNNVDLVLLNCSEENISRDVLKNPDVYMALGELKGGIDPAGADEHWKTARTALQRIRKGFSSKRFKPHIFFIGAAVQTKMAKEIWKMLVQGHLENAANLTDDDQIASIANWLCSL